MTIPSLLEIHNNTLQPRSEDIESGMFEKKRKSKSKDYTFT